MGETVVELAERCIEYNADHLSYVGMADIWNARPEIRVHVRGTYRKGSDQWANVSGVLCMVTECGDAWPVEAKILGSVYIGTLARDEMGDEYSIAAVHPWVEQWGQAFGPWPVVVRWS